MTNSLPITGLIHHRAPEPPSPPSCSCQEKPPFPTAGCHGNPSLRIPSQRPASSLDHSTHRQARAAHPRWIKDERQHRAPQERHPQHSTRGSPSRDAHPRQRDGNDSFVPLVKKGKESGEPEIPTNPPSLLGT